MFKRPKSGPAARGGFRKRSAPDQDESGGPVVAVVVKAARTASSTQQRGAAFSTRDEDGVRDGADDVTAATAVFGSNRSVERVEHRGGAFEYSQVDAETDKDARAQLERKVKLAASRTDESSDDGLYRGAAAYRSYVRMDESQIGGNKYTGTKGPIRAPQFVRNTCRFDFQPDVCKDYKDTGFCGYGDSCKFLHDRGDYKTGWQLEAEFQRQKEKEKEREMLGRLADSEADEAAERDRYAVGGGGGGDDSREDLPFACSICRGPFKDPMQTLCRHYFCAACAQARFRERGTRCPVCDRQTSGVLNAAPKLRAKARAVGGFDNFFQTMIAVRDSKQAAPDTDAYKDSNKQPSSSSSFSPDDVKLAKLPTTTTTTSASFGSAAATRR